MKETDREADRTADAAAADPPMAWSTSMVGALVLLAAVQTMVVLDTTIVNVALPTIQSSLGFSASSIAWVVNGYAVAFGALLLLGGRSGDLLGRRRVFVASLGAFALASSLGGLASGPNTLIAARVLQGGAAAFAQASALSLIVSTFPAGRPRNRAIGVFAAMEGLGAAAGLLLGGVLVEVASWRWVFFVNVPVAAIVAVLAPRFIPSPARQHSRFDLAGAVAASGGVGLIVLGLSRAAYHGWLATWTILPVAVGVLGLAAFVFNEAHSSHPLTPLWVFGDRNRSGAYLIQALMGAALFGMFYLSTLFLQHVLGYSPLKAGAAFIPGSVITMVAAVVVSKLVARTGVRPLVASGTGIAAVAMLLLSRLSPHSNYLTVLLPMLLLSCGLGITFVPATIAAVSGVTGEHSGLVSGVSTTATQLGGSIGLAALATIAAATIRRQPRGTSARQAAAIGYAHAFRFGGVIIALAVPIALVTLRLRPGNDDARPEAGPATAEPSQPASADIALVFAPDAAHPPVVPRRSNLRDPR
jgi:EmrB/QacA subfamily drug resistance transporter